MFETLCPASLANPEKAELPPSTQREMGWRAELPPVKVPVNPHRLDAARIPATAPELSKLRVSAAWICVRSSARFDNEKVQFSLAKK
jgi:hypothetical protein